MKIVKTHEARPDDFGPFEREMIYNGLDCCVTAEVLSALLPQLDNHTAATYSFSRELQGPALEMRLRGVLVDQARKAEVIDEYHEKIEFLNRNLERIVLDGVGLASFNWRSSADRARLFYDILGIPPVSKGGRPTTDRAAREKLEAYTIAKSIVAHINTISDLAKKISVLRTAIDPDGRIRTSYNIAGTNTGRFSSSLSEFGTGGNLQNVEEGLRSIFISDPKQKFAKFDTKSGESYCVGGIEWNLFQDGAFLDAVESGDLHTNVAIIVWPDYPWTGNPKVDKKLAEQPFYRHYDRRFMCKKIGHGSNYAGMPETLAGQAKVPVNLVREFQPKYFKAFPAHKRWHEWVDNQLRTTGQLISLTGRKRQFWGRRNDLSTFREAVAYDPQGSLADIVNTVMLKIWRLGIATVMMHDHDALTFQYPQEREDEIIPILLENLRHPIPLKHGRVLEIPVDCNVGWNRGKYDPKKNPDGLREYIPGDQGRKRSEPVHLLDRKR